MYSLKSEFFSTFCTGFKSGSSLALKVLNVSYHSALETKVPLKPFCDFVISGQHFLKKSKTHRDKFERGNTDEFELKAPKFGEVTSIK